VAEVEAEVVPEEPEVQAAAEEVEVVLEGPAEGRVPAGQGRGLPGGRGNRPEEARKPENKCSSSKSR